MGALAGVMTSQKLDLQAQSLDSEAFQSKYQHLRGVRLETYRNECSKLLLGIAHLPVGLVLKCRESEASDPVAVKSRLGWTVCGGTDKTHNVAAVTVRGGNSYRTPRPGSAEGSFQGGASGTAGAGRAGSGPCVGGNSGELSSPKNADQDILQRKCERLQHEPELETVAPSKQKECGRELKRPSGGEGPSCTHHRSQHPHSDHHHYLYQQQHQSMHQQVEHRSPLSSDTGSSDSDTDSSAFQWTGSSSSSSHGLVERRLKTRHATAAVAEARARHDDSSSIPACCRRVNASTEMSKKPVPARCRRDCRRECRRNTRKGRWLHVWQWPAAVSGCWRRSYSGSSHGLVQRRLKTRHATAAVAEACARSSSHGLVQRRLKTRHATAGVAAACARRDDSSSVPACCRRVNASTEMSKKPVPARCRRDCRRECRRNTRKGRWLHVWQWPAAVSGCWRRSYSGSSHGLVQRRLKTRHATAAVAEACARSSSHGLVERRLKTRHATAGVAAACARRDDSSSVPACCRRVNASTEMSKKPVPARCRRDCRRECRRNTRKGRWLHVWQWPAAVSGCWRRSYSGSSHGLVQRRLKTRHATAAVAEACARSSSHGLVQRRLKTRHATAGVAAACARRDDSSSVPACCRRVNASTEMSKKPVPARCRRDCRRKCRRNTRKGRWPATSRRRRTLSGLSSSSSLPWGMSDGSSPSEYGTVRTKPLSAKKEKMLAIDARERVRERERDLVRHK
ncbi:uncharacterized protein LOC118462031 isoform X2 [Anopheles albimanus]|uniref:uncharacterized protein LOC118462031 isoform X2 n=1 Tax=Anopheles albimanus TaxID=7167 RepID=UPI00163F6024|nr:uncharacterized protein LOC118462031 isoform X2 [Anopheles albimanus]